MHLLYVSLNAALNIYLFWGITFFSGRKPPIIINYKFFNIASTLAKLLDSLSPTLVLLVFSSPLLCSPAHSTLECSPNHMLFIHIIFFSRALVKFSNLLLSDESHFFFLWGILAQTSTYQIFYLLLFIISSF